MRLKKRLLSNNSPTVVLFEPKIPQNTGNIVRTCAAVGADLALVEPLGFRFSSRLLKRAGLDYWEHVHIERLAHLDEVLRLERPAYFFSSHATRRFDAIPFAANDLYIFGSETDGLPQTIPQEQCYFIPQHPSVRCLNLSNAVAVVLYAAWAKRGFVL